MVLVGALAVGGILVLSRGLDAAPTALAAPAASTIWVTAGDAAGIQPAIDAASAAGGGVVYLPAGAYYLTTKVSIRSSVTLVGAGMDRTVLRWAAGGYVDNMLTNASTSGNSDFQVRDLTLDGQGYPGTSASCCFGVRLRNVSNSYFVNVASDGHSKDGFYLGYVLKNGVPQGVSNTRLSGVRAQYNGRNGVAITQGDSNIVDGGDVRWNNQKEAVAGIDLEPDEGNAVTNSRIVSNTVAYQNVGIQLFLPFNGYATNASNAVCTNNVSSNGTGIFDKKGQSNIYVENAVYSNGLDVSFYDTTPLQGSAYAGSCQLPSLPPAPVVGPPPPPAPTLVSPSGNVATATPTFVWNALPNVTSYSISVSGPSGVAFSQGGIAPGSACSGSTCSYTPATFAAQTTYSWAVQAEDSGAVGPWSAALTFFTNVQPTGVPALSAPTGTVTVRSPAMTWSAVSGAEWYEAKITGPSGTAFDQWVAAGSLSCPVGACTYAPALDLPNGSYSVSVQAFSLVGGYGTWSTSLPFTVAVQPTGVATLAAPTGAIATRTPAFAWSAVSGAVWYELAVDGPSGRAFDQWLDAGSLGCSGGTCSITPPSLNLANGSYSWLVRAYGPNGGYGAWTAAMPFSVNVAPTGVPTLTAPTGAITSATPTFGWSAVSGAVWYELAISGPSGTIFDQWVTASSVSCPSGACSYAPPTLTLANGAYTWKMRVYDSSGSLSAFSPSTSFAVAVAPTAAPTLVAPTGTVTTASPTFTWNPVSGAVWYQLTVTGSAGAVFDQWLAASNLTCSEACTYAATLTLPNGSYGWQMRAYAPAGGYSAVTASTPFTVNAPVTSFDSQFKGASSGWQAEAGSWSVASSEFYSTTGLANSIASASYAATFSNFDYRVQLGRSGCASCATQIVVRGTPSPLDGSNRWSTGYVFQYSINGQYSVARWGGGSGTMLQNWTPAPAIVQGTAWNTLRVVANGSALSLYVNDTLLWTGTDSTYASGKVGVAMQSDGASGNGLWVDWATLSPVGSGDAGSQTAKVGAEQQALNDAAMRRSGGSAEMAPSLAGNAATSPTPTATPTTPPATSTPVPSLTPTPSTPSPSPTSTRPSATSTPTPTVPAASSTATPTATISASATATPTPTPTTGVGAAASPAAVPASSPAPALRP